jgi:hypothetical protein
MRTYFFSITKNNILLIFGFFAVCSDIYGQTSKISIKSNDTVIATWVKDLYEPGVKVEEDSIFMNEEAQKLMNDEIYRNLIYPKSYTWQTTLNLIQKQELKKAFWYFINLYLVSDQNKDLVIKSILTYDKLFKMDKVLVSTFYTYSLTDPEIGTIKEGKSNVTSPHIMEKKLQALKEMLFYLDKYRKEDKKAEIK